MIQLISFIIQYTRDVLGNFIYKSHSKLKKYKVRHIGTLEQYIESFVDETKEHAFRKIQHVKDVKFEVLHYDDTYYIHVFLYYVYDLLKKHKLIDVDVDDLFQNSIILTVFDDVHGLPIFSGVLSYKNINHSNLENYINNKNKTYMSKQIVLS